MLQYEPSELEDNLSREKVGQIIVDTIGQLLNIDIAILHLEKLASSVEQYFFYQKPNAGAATLRQDLLKLTVASSPADSPARSFWINQYDVDDSVVITEQGQACAEANIGSTLAIPLSSQANLAASLTIHRLRVESASDEVESELAPGWAEHELATVKMMAIQANLMLSQMMVREKLQELAHRETAINRITATIRSSLEPPVMFAAIARELGEALAVDGCTLSLWSKDDQFVKCVGLYNPHETKQIIIDSAEWQQATTSSVPILENPILQALLFKKTTIALPDLQQQQALARYELPWHTKARALMIVPLVVEEEIIGSITLRQSTSSRQWSFSEIELAETVASQAAIAIQQVLTYQKAKELAQRETTINRITATIRSSLEPPVMFATIVRELGEALAVDGCTLSLWTKSDRFVRCVGLYNPQEPKQIIIDSSEWQRATTSNVPILQNPILQALLFKKKTIDLSDLQQQKALARYELPWHAKARALMIVPLIVEEEIIGSITLRQSGQTRQWSSSEVELAEAVASQAAIAVQQAKLYQKLWLEEQKVRKLNTYLTESVLKRFLPPSIVNKAARRELSLDLTPEPRRVTVLFCDLVGFTNLSSHLGVVSLAEILNEYLEAMSKAVFDRGGTVDKFMGDGVMAMFGAPEDLSCPEQARRALDTAQTMYFYLAKLNERWQSKAYGMNQTIPLLKMRCGIHQGKAVVGMFGGSKRKDYTAVGRVVNIASRLQNVAEPNTIVLSEAIANCLGKRVSWGKGTNLKLKGIEQDFQAFTIRVNNLRTSENG